MSKNIAIFFGVGVAIVAIGVALIVYGNRGSHLELQGEIIKIRTGAIDEHDSAAVLDFRLQNVSDVLFEVRDLKVTAEEPDGAKDEGDVISKSQIGELLQYNKFLGRKFNDGLAIKDKIAPHQTIDRMVAVRFDVPQTQLDKARQVRLWIQDMNGAEFETVKRLGDNP